jgi:hypothetical protein
MYIYMHTYIDSIFGHPLVSHLVDMTINIGPWGKTNVIVHFIHNWIEIMYPNFKK